MFQACSKYQINTELVKWNGNLPLVLALGAFLWFSYNASLYFLVNARTVALAVSFT
jgi:hypothetical protein